MADETKIAADGRRYRADDVAKVNEELSKDGKTTVKSAAELAAEDNSKSAVKAEPAVKDEPEAAKPTVSFGTSDGPPVAPKEFKKASRQTPN